LRAQVTEDATKAGAKFVVNPISKKEIVETTHKYEVPAMSGFDSLRQKFKQLMKLVPM
jgi:2-keto-3-deoxy-6-phosphogluconate aldolase